MTLLTRKTIDGRHFLDLYKSRVICEREFFTTLDEDCKIMEAGEVNCHESIDLSHVKYIVHLRDNSTKDLCVWQVVNFRDTGRRGEVVVEAVGAHSLPVCRDELINNLRGKLFLKAV